MTMPMNTFRDIHELMATSHTWILKNMVPYFLRYVTGLRHSDSLKLSDSDEQPRGV